MTRTSPTEEASDLSGKPEAQAPAQPGRGLDKTSQNRRSWAWCLAIAIAFGAWSLRTNGPYNIAETDAARHAMNGVFLHDLIARGNFTDIVPFARSYFAHLPALSMPYHPPLFPLMEAVAYFLFGVNALAARLVVALATAVSAIVLFRLVASTHKSILVASLSTVTFLALPESVWVGGDVMLEYPTLVSTLLALYCLHRADEAYSMRRALTFAVLAGAAVWTKQQAVFLIGVPFLYFALIGRWRVFREAPIWVSTAVSSAMVGALTVLSTSFNGAAVAQVTSYVANGRRITHLDILRRNFFYYTGEFYGITGPAGLILFAAVVIALLSGRLKRRPTALYASWIVVSMTVLFLIRPITTRYLFFTLPALIVLGYAGFLRIGERLGGRRAAAAAAMLVCGLAIYWKFPRPSPYLHGPEEAARMLAAIKPARILYCGGTDGQFIFSYRSFRQGLDTTIISGDKLPPAVFTPAGIENFAHDYGVEYVVVEDVKGLIRSKPWVGIVNQLPPSLIPEREIPLSGSGRWNGKLRVYRFDNPSPAPKDYLSMRMQMIGGTMGFQLDRKAGE